MDYERRIRQLEQELGHLKVLQAGQRAHLDVHDEGFEAVGARFDRIENNLLQFSEGLKQLQVAQLITEQKFQNLLTLLAHSQSNGHSKEAS